MKVWVLMSYMTCDGIRDGGLENIYATEELVKQAKEKLDKKHGYGDAYEVYYFAEDVIGTKET